VKHESRDSQLVNKIQFLTESCKWAVAKQVPQLNPISTHNLNSHKTHSLAPQPYAPFRKKSNVSIHASQNFPRRNDHGPQSGVGIFSVSTPAPHARSTRLSRPSSPHVLQHQHVPCGESLSQLPLHFLSHS